MLTASMKSLIPPVERTCEVCKTVVMTTCRILRYCDKCRPAIQKEQGRKWRRRMAAKMPRIGL